MPSIFVCWESSGKEKLSPCLSQTWRLTAAELNLRKRFDIELMAIWRAIFLIAGMLPLGVAMQKTGAAEFLADEMMAFLGDFGPWPVIAGLYGVTALATMIVPTAALVLLMAPIVLSASAELGISPHAAMMAVAVAASASVTSPISHPVNVLAALIKLFFDF